MSHLQRMLVYILALLTAFSCMAQNRVSLDVGSVTVWLGMPRSDAMKKLSEAGYKVIGDGDSLTVSSSGNVQFLTFRNGGLIFANRVWGTSEYVDEAGAVMGALSALAEKTKTNACTVSHDPVSEPGISVGRIFINCGHIIRTDGILAVERSVMISVNGSGEKRTLGMTESIGQNTALH